jgi:hypothetical protein
MFVSCSDEAGNQTRCLLEAVWKLNSDVTPATWAAVAEGILPSVFRGIESRLRPMWRQDAATTAGRTGGVTIRAGFSNSFLEFFP